MTDRFLRLMARVVCFCAVVLIVGAALTGALAPLASICYAAILVPVSIFTFLE